MNKFIFQVVIEKDSEGYFASCPALQGCYTQGDSYNTFAKSRIKKSELFEHKNE